MKLVRACRSMLGAAALVAFSLTAVACVNAPTTSPGAPFSVTDLAVGTGTVAATGDVVSVNYTGWLYDSSKIGQKGLQFDTTNGREVFLFTLGGAQVIAGWDEGVPGMAVGGIRRLVIPPSLGYGQARFGPIPPNSTLVFEIQLVEVQKPQ